MADAQGGDRWRLLFELAGAAAGLVILVEIVGGAIVWARLHALDLPAARGVSLLAPEYLLAVGTSAVFWSLVLGLLGVLLLYAVAEALPEAQRGLAGRIAIAVLLTVLVTLTFLLSLTGAQRLLTLAAGALAAVAFFGLSRTSWPFRRSAFALFFLVATLGGILAFVRNYGPPAKLELAFVHLRDGGVTSGAYIGTTGSDVLIAPDSFDATYAQIVAIPRADVVRLTLTEPRDFRSAGSGSPTALIAGGRERPADVRRRALERYFAAWAGDPIWHQPPITFLESERALAARDEEFFPARAAPLARDGARVPLALLVRDARVYAGRPVRTRGRVRQAFEPAAPPGAVDVPRVLVLEPPGGRGERLLCAVVVPRSADVRPGALVDVRGVVVAAGRIAAAEPVPGAFMQCSAARPVERG